MGDASDLGSRVSRVDIADTVTPHDTGSHQAWWDLSSGSVGVTPVVNAITTATPKADPRLRSTSPTADPELEFPRMTDTYCKGGGVRLAGSSDASSASAGVPFLGG